MHLIARAEQNVFGLTRKLEKRGHEAACVSEVIARLCETGLLDDRRYARLWLESRISGRASSPRRLLIGLNSRGIDRNDADSALREALDDETELQLLRRFAEKSRRKKKAGDDSPRMLKYLLKSEGFSSIAIERFVDEF